MFKPLVVILKVLWLIGLFFAGAYIANFGFLCNTKMCILMICFLQYLMGFRLIKISPK